MAWLYVACWCASLDRWHCFVGRNFGAFVTVQSHATRLPCPLIVADSDCSFAFVVCCCYIASMKHPSSSISTSVKSECACSPPLDTCVLFSVPDNVAFPNLSLQTQPVNDSVCANLQSVLRCFVFLYCVSFGWLLLSERGLCRSNNDSQARKETLLATQALPAAGGTECA